MDTNVESNLALWRQKTIPLVSKEKNSQSSSNYCNDFFTFNIYCCFSPGLEIYLYLDDGRVLATTLRHAPARLSKEKGACVSELVKNLDNEDGVEIESDCNIDY